MVKHVPFLPLTCKVGTIRNAFPLNKDYGLRQFYVVEDIGFVVVENRQGRRSYSNSTGVTFGERHGTDYFATSEETHSTQTAGSLYSPENPHNPHKKATCYLYDRVDLLIPPIAIALHQLAQLKPLAI